MAGYSFRNNPKSPKLRVSHGKLTAAKRNKLSSKTFGLPGSRKYPMPDRSHGANAKARATQQVKAGNLSPSSAAKIRSKANRILGKKQS